MKTTHSAASKMVVVAAAFLPASVKTASTTRYSEALSLVGDIGLCNSPWEATVSRTLAMAFPTMTACPWSRSTTCYNNYKYAQVSQYYYAITGRTLLSHRHPTYAIRLRGREQKGADRIGRYSFFSSSSDNDTPDSDNNANRSLEDDSTHTDRKYLKSYHMVGEGVKSQVTMHATDTGHKIRTDVPKKMGGSDTAPQPIETLLAAYAGCTQATAMFVGRQIVQPKRLLIDKLEFDLIAYRDERGAISLPIDVTPTIPARLQCIEGQIRVHLMKRKKKEVVTKEEMKMLEHQTETRCPIANMMIASGCRMDIKWILVEDDINEGEE